MVFGETYRRDGVMLAAGILAGPPLPGLEFLAEGRFCRSFLGRLCWSVNHFERARDLEPLFSEVELNSMSTLWCPSM